jgi:hypothetical protein
MIDGCPPHVLRSMRVALATYQCSCWLAPEPVRDLADAINAVTQAGLGFVLLRRLLSRMERKPAQAAMPGPPQTAAALAYRHRWCRRRPRLAVGAGGTRSLSTPGARPAAARCAPA